MEVDENHISVRDQEKSEYSNNTNNINSNVIVVNNYGKENTDYLNPNYLKNLLNMEKIF